MNYQVGIDGNNEIPLPDDLGLELNVAIDDILLCKNLYNTATIVLSKHVDQTSHRC